MKKILSLAVIAILSFGGVVEVYAKGGGGSRSGGSSFSSSRSSSSFSRSTSSTPSRYEARRDSYNSSTASKAYEPIILLLSNAKII